MRNRRWGGPFTTASGLGFVAVAAALVALAAGCLPVQDGGNPNLAGQSVRLTFLHTSDIHSRLLPYDLAPLKSDTDLGLSAEAPPYGGAARLASLIKREREKSDRVMLVDSGDCFQGAPIFNANDGEAEIRFMSLMGYDAVVIGNHEFDKGAHNFADKAQRFANYPLLAANYLWENTNDPNSHGIAKISQPYELTNVRGVRVATLGMANISSLNSIVEGGNSMQAVPLEQNEIARSYVDLLRPVADLIVVVSHLGLTEDQDLILGYEAYYSYERAKPFLDRKSNPWKQVDPPPAEPGQPPNTYVDGTIRVYIPGVSGIDLIEGGHLHIVLNPPQELKDPSGRTVILSHSGAFAKYLGRLDTVIEFPPAKPEGVAEDSPEMQAWKDRQAEGAEIRAHDYRVFPVDGLWCDDEARSWRNQLGSNDPERYRHLVADRPRSSECRDGFYNAVYAHEGQEFADACLADYDKDFRRYECDRYVPLECRSRIEQCTAKEDQRTSDLLMPYVMGLDTALALPRIFAFAPRDIARRNNSTGGDSPLGNMCAESMRVRRRVEAELALTNTLGIRDNLYAGPITLESMFNVFPFENTINIMYLSGAELHELTDFVAARSSDRGCQSQAQISGLRFVMDCAQAQKNAERHPCQKDDDCLQLGALENRDGAWRCTEEKVCWAPPSYGLKLPDGKDGREIDPAASYKIAVNDYIAKGGSGFQVLKRNTTRIETGISLRDSLIDYMRGQCTCREILAAGDDAKKMSSAGFACANVHDGKDRVIDPQVKDFCQNAKGFEDYYQNWLAAGSPGGRLEGAPFVQVGKCGCQEIVNEDEKACGHVTRELKSFCTTPTAVPIAIGDEDGRIGRRVR